MARGKEGDRLNRLYPVLGDVVVICLGVNWDNPDPDHPTEMVPESAAGSFI
jgi:hypothetical protein